MRTRESMKRSRIRLVRSRTPQRFIPTSRSLIWLRNSPRSRRAVCRNHSLRTAVPKPTTPPCMRRNSQPAATRSSYCAMRTVDARRLRFRRWAMRRGGLCRHRWPALFMRRAPYCYRCPFKLTYPECGLACANDIEELIMTTTTGEIAAFMAEPILGVGGFIVPPAGYFERAVEITRKHGGLFIADEVQTSWRRTGEKWFGIENWNVEPDIITSAKGLGNGVPIGITVATPEVADKFPGLTFSTFGGNPVSCAAALAVLKVIEDNGQKKNSAVVE